MCWLSVSCNLCNKDLKNNPTNIYLFKVDSRRRCEICSKLAIKTSDDVSDVVLVFFFVNFQPVSHLFQVFQLTCMLTGKVLKYVNVPVVQEMI